MELSAATSNKADFRSSLLFLAADCLHYIFTFEIPNGVTRLLLTGNKRLIHMLRTTNHLSLEWTKSSFVRWQSALPLIKSFPNLNSLALSTYSQYLLSQGPVNPGIFPPTLRSLTLRFQGCAELLRPFHAPTFLTPLVSLELLEINDMSHSYGSPISLLYFPTSLRSLRIQSEYQVQFHVMADLSTLKHLPIGLETLHLHIFSSGPGGDGHLHQWPPQHASITDLSIRAQKQQDFDISPIAAQLKHLRIYGRAVRLGALIECPLATGTVKTFFPVLQSLTTDMYTLSDWNQLRNLPPSLTVLRVAFAVEFPSIAASHKTLEDLNANCEGSDGVLQYAAPKNLRIVESHGNDNFGLCTIPPELLRHFHSLIGSVSSLISTAKDDTLTELPHGLTQLRFHRLHLSTTSSLPPRVSRLSTETISYESEDLTQLLSARNFLAGLCELEFTHRAFPIELISLLPRTLETLKLATPAENVLKHLVQSSDAGLLPNLAYLELNLALSYSAAAPKIALTMSTVPSTLTKLNATEGYTLITPDPTASLANHPRLVAVLLKDVDLLQTLPHLPRRLEVFSIYMSALINLAIPEEALALYGMRQQLLHLKHLHLQFYRTSPQRRPYGMTSHWILPVSPQNPPQVSFMRWLTLPMSLKTLYAQHFLAKRSLWSSKAVRHSSELFALSCTPRGISALMLPTHDVADHINRISMLRFTPRRFVYATLKYQFPLLGLAIHHLGDPSPRDRVASVLPPHLSVADVVHEQTELLKLLSQRFTGFPRIDYTDPLPEKAWLWSLEPAYHVTNALSWLLIGLYGASSWRQSAPLQGLIWSSMLGSALYAPILIWKLYSSGLILPNLSSRVKKSSFVALGVTFLLNLGLNLLLSFGIGSTSYLSFFRAMAVTFSVIVSAGRNHILRTIRR